MRTHLSFIQALIFGCLCYGTACQRADEPAGPSEPAEPGPSEPAEPGQLEIEWDSPVEIPTDKGEVVDEAAGLYARVYTVPPTFPLSGPGGDGGGAAAADPFAAAAEGRSKSSAGGVESAGKSVLEDYGVDFPEGAGAVYNPATGELTVTATADQLALVDAVLESIQKGLEKIINVRVEIFEMPAIQVLELEQSSETRGNHAAEWKAVLEQVRKGGARFVTSAGIQSRSGQRSQIQDISERVYISNYDWADKEKKERMVPVFDSRKVGTIFEVDPVLGPDDVTIHLNFSLEHHSAPPSEVINRVRFPGSDQAVEVSLMEFHPKKITTAIQLISGHVKLIGAWRPTGKPEYENADRMLIAFLKADVQSVFRIGRIR